MGPRSTYHHGDLRAALVEATTAVVAEHGVAGLSVGEVARRAGVSAAAPYRHFANRSALLAATATSVGRELHAGLAEAMSQEEGGVAELGAAARAYVAFVLTRGVGFDLVWADELRPTDDLDLARASGDLVSLLLFPCLGVAGEPAAAQRLLRRVTAVVNGFATLRGSGFMAGHDVSTDTLAEEAAEVVVLLATAAAR